MFYLYISLKGKEARDMADKGYAGKIKNSGSQVVQAPYAGKSTAKGTVTKGNDLRSGK